MAVLVRTTALRSPPIRPGEVRRRATRMLEALRLADAELSVLLCDDPTIQDLNRRYRRKNKPTDVLAFPLGEGAPPTELLGDVVISVPTARRQARRAGRTIAAEVTHLLAHGLLHLLGYDHQTRAQERRMNALTDMLTASARPVPKGGRK